MRVEISADFRRNREPRRYGQTYSGHFGQVRAFAAEQPFHFSVSVGFAFSKVINGLRGLASPRRVCPVEDFGRGFLLCATSRSPPGRGGAGSGRFSSHETERL